MRDYMSESATLLRCAIEGREPEAVARWIGDALAAHLSRGGAGLEAALGFTGGGLRQAARAARDGWLREAAALAAPGAGLWAQAGELHAAERASRLARARAAGRGMLPPDPVAAAIALAERLGALPSTRRQLLTVLARSSEAGGRAISAARGVA